MSSKKQVRKGRRVPGQLVVCLANKKKERDELREKKVTKLLFTREEGIKDLREGCALTISSKQGTSCSWKEKSVQRYRTLKLGFVTEKMVF